LAAARCAPKLEAEAARLNLTNIELRDYQPREQLAAALCVPDVHLVILNPKLEGLIVPSKFYSVAAAGRPVIFIGDRSGEVARIVKEEGIGFAVPPSRPGELKQRILELAASPQLCHTMGSRARAAFEKQWDKPVAIERWARLLGEEIGRPQPSKHVAEPAASARQATVS
jgi:colanic acid biosynthesis glycosyl transferase WcaI